MILAGCLVAINNASRLDPITIDWLRSHVTIKEI
jgi:hypothetical protein